MDQMSRSGLILVHPLVADLILFDQAMQALVDRLVDGLVDEFTRAQLRLPKPPRGGPS